MAASRPNNMFFFISVISSQTLPCYSSVRNSSYW